MKTSHFLAFAAIALTTLLGQANAAPLDVTKFFKELLDKSPESSPSTRQSMLETTGLDITTAMTTVDVTTTPTETATRTFMAVADGARIPPMTAVEQYPHPTTSITARDALPPLVGTPYPRSAPPTCNWIEYGVFVKFEVDGLRDWHFDESGIQKRLNKCGAVTEFGVDPESEDWYAASGLLNNDGSVDKENLRYQVSWHQPQLTDGGRRCVEKVIAEKIGNDVQLPCRLGY